MEENACKCELRVKQNDGFQGEVMKLEAVKINKATMERHTCVSNTFFFQ